MSLIERHRFPARRLDRQPRAADRLQKSREVLDLQRKRGSAGVLHGTVGTCLARSMSLNSHNTHMLFEPGGMAGAERTLAREGPLQRQYRIVDEGRRGPQG